MSKKRGLKQIVRDAAIGFMFGLKRADDEMFAPKGDEMSADVSQEQIQHSKSVVGAMLRGEITQDVEELRYSMYAVGKKMRDYTVDEHRNIHHQVYVEKTGNVIKQENFQENLTADESFAMGNRLGNKYHINFKYKHNPPRFDLDKFITFVEFNIETKICTIYFTTTYQPFVASSNAFINAMKRIGTYTNDKQYLMDPIVNNIEEIEFTTLKAQGREDFFRFLLKNLTTDVNTIQYSNNGFDARLSFKVGDYTETDERAKYECQSMQDKYDRKAPREGNIINPFMPDPEVDKEVEFYCYECGKRIDVTEYRMNEFEYGHGLCDDCAAKYRGLKATEEDKKDDLEYGYEEGESNKTC